MTYRNFVEIRRSHPSRDGDGVAIQRISGMRHAGMDPILLLDELRSDYREDFAGGFPPHPHRGMQTLTYLKKGGIIHEDSQGNRGEIRSGGAQWMSAGRGVIHSEMPTQDSDGLHGFQLWYNLPAAEKMSEPRYRDVPVNELLHLNLKQGRAVLVAGEWQLDDQSVSGPLDGLSAGGALADVELQAHGEVQLQGLVERQLLVYVYQGALQLPAPLGSGQMALTGPGDALSLTAGDEGASFLLLGGQPLREPVANYGPFVMNTAEEIEQAIQDYQAGRFAA